MFVARVDLGRAHDPREILHFHHSGTYSADSPSLMWYQLAMERHPNHSCLQEAKAVEMPRGTSLKW